MSVTSSDPMIGRLLDGRYRIEARIARGGMATVYTAIDTRLGRPVAVKVMHTGLGSDVDFASRFVREAQSAARLNHPSVVAVFDQGEDDGIVYLVMEYVDGDTLRHLLDQEAPLQPQRAVALLEQVLIAVSAAHDAGLVHRDLKPENVLIASNGQVKVADFGLARAVNANTSATATTGVLVGTVSYLAPELVLHQGADARSDVYACGVLLYEMLTGRKPHEGETPIQVAYKHVHEDIPMPSAIRPELPPYLDALVARSTARERDLRPADAKVLLRQARR
ncbi:MAG TPA: protein kinase, partial [Nocardioidaceae bacterium]|nr:protein kinase [Nocardioidaceae bacterium]